MHACRLIILKKKDGCAKSAIIGLYIHMRYNTLKYRHDNARVYITAKAKQS